MPSAYSFEVPRSPAELLSDTGPIAAKLTTTTAPYESRPEQLKMAERVTRALDQRERLLVEAGTGVGKSFAYLVPAIARILEKGEKVVVATATIALQEQLIHKDIPLLIDALGLNSATGVPAVSEEQGAHRRDARATDGQFQLIPVLAKGRGNYLSIRRLAQASKRQDLLLQDDAQRRSLHAIEDWAYTTTEGSLATLPVLERPEVWDHVRSDSDNCMGRKCENYKKCFYQAARRELERANLIICNHALFFSDLAIRTRGATSAAILPFYDHVILDEAHNIEDAACEHFGLSLAQPRVWRLLRTLFNSKRRKGYLLENTLKIGDTQTIERAMTLVLHAEHAAQLFFDALAEHHDQQRQSDGGAGRIRQENIIDNPLTPAMAELATCLRRIRDTIEQEADRFELNAFAKRAQDIADTAEAMIAQTLPDYVYWTEVEGSRGSTGEGRFGPRVTLACAPIDIAPILKRYLFDPPTTADTSDPPPDAGDAFDADEPIAPPTRPLTQRKGIILTSATLATRTIRSTEHLERAETAFAHVMTNLGLAQAATLQLGSPFDYARQARLIIDLSVPNPRSTAEPQRPGASPYTRALAQRILHHLRTTAGGAFVLFTSFGTLYAVADTLAPELADLGLTPLVQGRDGSRSAILKKFTDDPQAVLFGAASFWQGVDVRGEGLRNVIITRLPFEPPDRPLTQARCERLEAAGANPFMQDSLPRAVIRFKQGFGRLIRSRTDTGQVVILDPRIKTARYGKLFLDALPPGVRIEETHATPSTNDV